MQQQELFDVLLKKDDVTWKDMIFDLVRTQQMDPWNIELSHLSQQFLEMLEKLREMDFRISGKIILAAAILLRLKSNKLVGEDMNELNRLIAYNEAEEEILDEYGDDYGDFEEDISNQREFSLTPKTPQPRKRKVSVYDLIDALDKALNVQSKRKPRVLDDVSIIKVEKPAKKVDIGDEIERIHAEIIAYLKNRENNKMTFTELVPSDDRNDKIIAFSVLMHLGNQRRVDLEQEQHLGEIEIYKLEKNADFLENEYDESNVNVQNTKIKANKNNSQKNNVEVVQ